MLIKLKEESQKLKVEQQFFATVKRFIFLCAFFYSLSASSQCAMCRASLESEGNVTKAEALNNGIVYLMIIPYILVAAVGFFVYKMYSNKKIK